MSTPALPVAHSAAAEHGPYLLGLDAEGWVYVGLTIFFLIAIFVAKAPKRITDALDQRIADTKRMMDEAKAIRFEAETLLAQAKAQQAAAATDAEASSVWPTRSPSAYRCASGASRVSAVASSSVGLATPVVVERIVASGEGAVSRQSRSIDRPTSPGSRRVRAEPTGWSRASVAAPRPAAWSSPSITRKAAAEPRIKPPPARGRSRTGM